MSKRNQIRLVMLFPTAMLGSFVFSFLHLCWVTFWLAEDARQTQATVTGERSHGVIDYKYVINGNQYFGQGQRSGEQDREARVGGQTSVYFSPSRPWLSSLQTPSFPPSGSPVLVIAILIEFLFVMTVINPKGKWALQTGLKQND